MTKVRWAECSNQDGKHEAWFAMFLKEAKQDRCPNAESRAIEGPGTEVKKLLGLFRIVPDDKCNCDDHVRIMNLRGCQWCRDNLDTIAGWLREESERRGLPFSESLARRFVSIAVWRADKIIDETEKRT